MPLHSNDSEDNILDFVFRQHSNLSQNDKEKNISSYYAIKHHMPSEIYQTNKLKFNYNKGISYILASFENITIFKIPNNKIRDLEIICPPSKEFVKTLEISDTSKELILKKYKDTKLDYWYIKLSPDELLSFSSKHWEGFSSILISLSNGTIKSH